MWVRAAAVVLLANACSHDLDLLPRRPRPPGGPRVDSFSESAAVTRVVPLPPWAFVGTSHGLDRFDLRTGEVVHLGRGDGLGGDQVIDLVATDARNVWVLTEGGLTHHDPSAGTFTVVPLPSAGPAAPLTVAAGALRALAADPLGGVWVGGAGGLYRAGPEDEMWPAGFARPVTALLATRTGDLWIGLKDGVAVRKKNGAFESFGAAEGYRLAAVRWIVEAPDGGIVCAGEDAEGHARLAFRDADGFSTFRPSPEPEIRAVVARPSDIVLLSRDRLYSLTRSDKGARVLRRAGMHLVSEARRKARSPYDVRLLDVELPRGATALGAIDGEIYVGTAGVGTERVAAGAPRWLRRRDLVKDAVDLTVACVAEEDCYLATGTARAWHYQRGAFAPFALEPGDTGLAPVVLAFVRAPGGAVVALLEEERRKLRVARLEKGTFAPVPDLALETPAALAGLTFAKFSPEGFLWLGLQLEGEHGERGAYGVASIDLSAGAVTVHRQEIGDADITRGELPVPRDVTDVAFASKGELWFATVQGAARIVGRDLTLFSESEGLEGGILRGIIATDGGGVFVASARGVGAFDGTRWSFPRALRVSAYTLARGADGRLWVGTDQGLLAYDGRRIARVDRKRGLLEDAVLDLTSDHLGRLWARGLEGVSVVDP